MSCFDHAVSPGARGGRGAGGTDREGGDGGRCHPCRPHPCQGAGGRHLGLAQDFPALKAPAVKLSAVTNFCDIV